MLTGHAGQRLDTHKRRSETSKYQRGGKQIRKRCRTRRTWLITYIRLFQAAKMWAEVSGSENYLPYDMN